eukprot:CAMPEP_0174695940 /NCGR_PEP_ID=MMETSP1094-20130205/2202_1 /TAXON_ID=156173 /ORGANISM="Chrysochromulina brevifilum, Strain UTEX LB 985" /LENGTH=65 /DNA_ID=CAMNT_0015892583 /DNA_START=1632 /DNA_END=1829 /DNA_ORIENTATION=+
MTTSAAGQVWVQDLSEAPRWDDGAGDARMIACAAQAALETWVQTAAWRPGSLQRPSDLCNAAWRA